MNKKILLIFGGILAALVLAALVAPFFISAEGYKKPAIAKIEAATGRRLAIDGAMALSLFPTAGVRAENVTLFNPPGFAKDAPPLLMVKSLKVEVELFALLRGEIIVKNLALREPRLHLHADGQGRGNWVFARPGAPKPREIGGGEKKPAPAAPFMLSNAEITGGTVIYSGGGAKDLEITGLDAVLTLASPAAAAMLEGKGELRGRTLRLKAGLGTLQSLMQERRADVKLALSGEGFSVNAEGNYGEGKFNGRSVLKAASLPDLAAWLGASAPIPVKALSWESDLRCGDDSCHFPKTRLALGALEAHGDLRLGVAGDRPFIKGELQTDVLDLNPFLPAAAQAGLSGLIIGDAVAQTERWSAALIDLSALRSFDADVTVKAGRTLYRKFSVGKAALNVKLHEGKLIAAVAEAVLYAGTGSFSLTAESNASPPSFEAQGLLRGVRIEELLKDAAGSDRLSGLADIQLNLRSRGASERALVSALSGEGQFKISSGAIKGVNLLNMLGNVQAAFAEGGESAAAATPFSTLSGSVGIAQGVVSNRDLALQMPGLTASGEGTVNLPAYTVDYRLSPRLAGAAAHARSIAVPVLITGSLDAPKFRPDLSALATGALQDPKKFKEELKNSRELLKEQLKNPKETIREFKGLLRGLKKE